MGGFDFVTLSAVTEVVARGVKPACLTGFACLRTEREVRSGMTIPLPKAFRIEAAVLVLVPVDIRIEVGIVAVVVGATAGEVMVELRACRCRRAVATVWGVFGSVMIIGVQFESVNKERCEC